MWIKYLKIHLMQSQVILLPMLFTHDQNMNYLYLVIHTQQEIILLLFPYFSPLLPHSVPPIVVPLAPGRQVIGNETGSATLSFRIDNAAPPVLLQDLQWFYAANFSSDPSVRQEITNLTNRTTNSTLTFSNFANMRYINLTVSNIAQRRRGIGGETDEGRYFLVATNPAGVSSSYIDLVVFGMYIMYVHISSWDAIHVVCTYEFT